MAKVYYDDDADLSALAGQRVAVIGYGSQGHAHALNLQDSGVDVVVGLYKGSKSWEAAEQEDLRVETVENAVELGNLVMMLVPDQTQKRLYDEVVKPNLKPGSALMFAHGWGGYRVKPDLSNLKEIMDACYETTGQSTVIDVPVDADQVIGLNPRLNNLTTKTYL